MVQETFGRNNKTLVNTFWHKTETEAVSQKLQVLLLRLLLFFPFRFVYLLPQTKRAVVNTPTTNSKRNCLSYQITQFLKIRIAYVSNCIFPLQLLHYYVVLVLSIYLFPINEGRV